MHKPTVILDLEKKYGITIEPVDSEEFRTAVEQYSKYAGKEVSPAKVAMYYEFKTAGKGAYYAEEGKVLSLNLTELPALTEFTIPEDLQDLRFLDLSDCRGENKGLEKLNFTAGLPQLEKLDVSDSRLKKIDFPKGFKALRHLDLSRNEIEEVAIDEGAFPVLETLDLSGNPLQNMPPDLVFSVTDLPHLKLLYLNESILNTSVLVYKERTHGKNCLPALKKLSAALRKGKYVENMEYKMLVVGDGNVGKSCFVARLIDNVFIEEWDSTHGISIKQFVDRDKRFGFKQILNIWDFGGQDIYHNTHRLFLQKNTIYLLLWKQDSEKPNSKVKQKIGRKTLYWANKGIAYWLEYIKYISGATPVIVGQTNSDPENSSSHPKEEDLRRKYKDLFRPFNFISIDSAKKDEEGNGYDDLVAEIRKSIRRLKRKEYLPESWVNIKREILKRRGKVEGANNTDAFLEGSKTMSYEDYLVIAKRYGEKEDADTLLRNWLVATGFVYYREGFFDNQIILDQEWAIRAVYILMERESDIREEIKNNRGCFSGEDLNKYWKDYAKTDRERQVFISFMLNCGLCFEINSDHKKDFSDREFIALELLPSKRPDSFKVLEEVWQSPHFSDNIIYVRYHYDFLLDSIIQRFIARTHDFAEISNIYAKGVIINDVSTAGTAIIEAKDSDDILVKLPASDVKLLNKIRNEFERTNREEKLTELVSLDGKRWVRLSKLKEKNTQQEKLETECGTLVNIKDYALFLKQDEKEVFEKPEISLSAVEKSKLSMKKPKLYFSYAWGDDKETGESREKIVDDLYQSLLYAGYDIRRDKNSIEYGEYISEFMSELGEGDLIFVFLSDKYLKSQYCMWELCEIWRNSKGDKSLFQKAVVPIRVESLNSRPGTLTKYFDFWSGEYREYENLIVKYPDRVSVPQQDAFNRIKEINQKFGDVFGYIMDMNAKTNQILRNEDFEEVKNVIEKRLVGESSNPAEKTTTELLVDVKAQMERGFRRLGLQLGQNQTELIQRFNLSELRQQELKEGLMKINMGMITKDEMAELVSDIKSHIEANLAKLPDTLRENWQAIQAQSKDEQDISEVLKLSLPIIPGILSYEVDINTNLKTWAANIWKKGIIL